MIPVKVIPKMWGNSIGVIIPKEKAASANVLPEKEITIWLEGRSSSLENFFGKLKGKKIDTQKVKDESRKIWAK